MIKVVTLTVLGLVSLDQTSAAEAATAETGTGECVLRRGRGVANPYLGNIGSGDVPYSSRKVILVFFNTCHPAQNSVVGIFAQRNNHMHRSSLQSMPMPITLDAEQLHLSFFLLVLLNPVSNTSIQLTLLYILYSHSHSLH